MTSFVKSTKYSALARAALLAPALLYSGMAASNQFDKALEAANKAYVQNCKQPGLVLRTLNNILQKPSNKQTQCNTSTKNKRAYHALDLSYHNSAAADDEFRKYSQRNNNVTTDYSNLGTSDFTTRSFASTGSIDTNLNRIAQPIKTLKGFETVNGKQQ